MITELPDLKMETENETSNRLQTDFGITKLKTLIHCSTLKTHIKKTLLLNSKIY